MDLNQLYHDHQLALIRVGAAKCGERRALHSAAAAIVARQIERIHRASGAAALRNWETRYASADQMPAMSRPRTSFQAKICAC